MRKRKGEETMDAFLKMIDDLQTPKHKTNHKYRSFFPRCIILKTIFEPFTFQFENESYTKSALKLNS